VNFESTKRPVREDRRIAVLLAGFAARTLDPSLHALIAAHLELLPDNRAYVAALEAAHGIFLAGIDPVPLPGRDRKLVNIFASREGVDKMAGPAFAQHVPNDVLPAPLRRFIGCDLSDLAFAEVSPGVEQAVVVNGSTDKASLLRGRPGASFRAHGHSGTEATLVLTGSLSDESGTYRRGNVAIADETIRHQPVVGPDGLLCFLVSQAAIDDQGTIGRLIGRVLGG
jgi:putative transcriptional regulator